jgi:hypothetical protein
LCCRWCRIGIQSDIQVQIVVPSVVHCLLCMMVSEREVRQWCFNKVRQEEGSGKFTQSVLQIVAGSENAWLTRGRPTCARTSKSLHHYPNISVRQRYTPFACQSKISNFGSVHVGARSAFKSHTSSCHPINFPATINLRTGRRQ